MFHVSLSQVCDDEQISVYSQKVDNATTDIISEIRSTVLQVPIKSMKGNDTNLTSLYSVLSSVYNISESTERLQDFTNAFDTIFNSYFTACYGPVYSRPTAEDVPELIEEFLILLANVTNIERVREIYGQLSCVGNFSVNSRKKRAESDETIALLNRCSQKDSIADLYNCLNESLQQCIFSLNDCSDSTNNGRLPVNCVGFVIDTTGSMGGEIADARSVITSFIQSEANVDVRCYTLVAFNDYDSGSLPGPYHINYASKLQCNAVFLITMYRLYVCSSMLLIMYMAYDIVYSNNTPDISGRVVSLF